MYSFIPSVRECKYELDIELRPRSRQPYAQRDMADLSSCLEEADEPVDDCFTLGLQPSNPPNCQRSLGLSQQPAAFWDNLSKIWLTRIALREFHRRNARLALSAPSSGKRQAHQLAARSAAVEHLNTRPSKPLKGIKPFARHGGPDLSDLRGVCIPAGGGTKAYHPSLSTLASPMRKVENAISPRAPQ